MLEKYVPNFVSDEFLQELAAENGIAKKEAMKICQKKIKLETYFQEKVKDGLKRKFPDAYVAKIAQGAYSQSGIPDILCILDGHYFGFEIKRPVLGKVTKLQSATINKIRAAGGTAEVVIWPEEAAEIIKNWRIGKNGQRETG